MRIPKTDSAYIDRLRGISILRVVLGHLGLFWIWPPYSEFFHAFLPLLFFVSGAVSFFSYARAPSTLNFLYRRLLSLLAPFYVLGVMSWCVVGLFGGGLRVDLDTVVSWMLLNPSRESMPFPLGQIWFLHALAIIVIIAVPIFALALRFRWIWLVPIAFSILLSTAQLFEPVHVSLYVGAHNTYQALSNLGFFCFGAMLYHNQESFGRTRLLGLLAAAVLVAVFVPWWTGQTIGLADHSFSPDLYYLAASYTAILLMMLFQPWLTWLLGRFTYIDKLLVFSSRHAYSIFLLHSLLTFAAERVFGLVDVADSPPHAVAKVLFVLVGTGILSIPFSYTTRAVTRTMNRHILGSPRTAQSLSEKGLAGTTPPAPANLASVDEK